MGITLSRQQHQQLLDWAKEAGNKECCGLLLGAGEMVSGLELTENVAADATRHFEIDPFALLARHKRNRDGGLPVLGCFHSHPNGLGRPSATDSLQAADDGQIWLIVANGEITAWIPSGKAGSMTEFASVALVVEG